MSTVQSARSDVHEWNLRGAVSRREVELRQAWSCVKVYSVCEPCAAHLRV